MLCRVACVLSFVAVMVWSEEWEWERFDNTAHAGDFLGPEPGERPQADFAGMQSVMLGRRPMRRVFVRGRGAVLDAHSGGVREPRAAGLVGLRQAKRRRRNSLMPPARTWKSFTTSRILAPCVADAAAEKTDIAEPDMRVDVTEGWWRSDRPLWSAWPMYHGACELKKSHLRNFRFDGQQQLTFDIGANVSIDQDEYLVLASSPRLRLLGNITPSQQQRSLVEASLKFPGGGPFFIEVYWMQSGAVGAVEPPSSAKILADLQEISTHPLRCSPQMPFFRHPRIQSDRSASGRGAAEHMLGYQA